MLDLIWALLLIPFLTGLFLILTPTQREEISSRASVIASSLYGLCAGLIILIWLKDRQHHRSFVIGDIYKSGEYRFVVSFLIDSLSCLWIFMVALLSGIVIRFSHVYMHKEDGYQRFFACLMFLIFGLTLLAVAGGLDLLMAGWEFVGICSFLLIGFYQDRLLPVRNAFKVYSVYRFCDAGLLLSAWLAHVLFHDGQTFIFMRSTSALEHLRNISQASLSDMTGLILLAAAGKSAQFPFTFWLSRAMEGPTPSSAIFYGSLSVHAGVFLLFRTFPLWQAAEYGPWMVGSIGLTTVVVASLISRAQSNIKGQIAYSSAAHVGMMFIELALGLKTLAMYHMLGNACLRCYQLLVSPSSVVYLLRLQGSTQMPSRAARPTRLLAIPKPLAATIYVLAMNDGFLEGFVRKILWHPMTAIGRVALRSSAALYLVIVPFVLLIGLYNYEQVNHPYKILAILTLSVTGTALTFVSLAEARSSLRAWHTVALSNLMVGLAIWTLEGGEIIRDLAMFFSGTALFWVVGWQTLLLFSRKGTSPDLRRYHALRFSNRSGAVLLFIAVLGMTGFPISPTFIGQDVLLHHAVDEFVWLAILVALIFAVNGLALMRIYSKVCLGPKLVD